MNIEMHQQETPTSTSTDEVTLPNNDQLVNESITQQQQDVAINIDDRFGPSCAPVLSQAQIVNNIIEASIRLDRQRWAFLFIPCIPFFIIMFLTWIIWVTVDRSSVSEKESLSFTLIIAIISTSLTGFMLLWALCYGAINYSNRNNYAMLQSNVRLLIKLEGDQWVRYVEYLYGSNRAGFGYFGVIGAMTFCLCRKPHYKKLIARGYGYIVLCEQGFILDEMTFVVRNQTHIILTVTYVTNMGLRVYLLKKNAKYVVRKYASEAERQYAAQVALKAQMVPLDILLPNIPQNMAAVLGLQIQYGL
ncbi:unnamed protein product [Adineta steineri]|uniref:Uncharacterized protein n=1 Tax=Adineta steineri TaxID=433720 RepID=A0A814XFR1_9BILA|nr:unnamed protein product [Adineta steineri]